MFENDTDIIHPWEFSPLFTIMMNHFFQEARVFNKWNKIIIGFGKMKDLKKKTQTESLC